MTIKSPNLEQLKTLAAGLGMTLDDADAASYLGLMQGNIEAYRLIEAMPDYVPQVTYPRTAGLQARRRGEQVQRLVREVGDQGRRPPASWPARRS